MLFFVGNPLTSSIPPIRSLQKSQQQHQQYGYSKFRNESSIEGNATPALPKPPSGNSVRGAQQQSEGVLIDLSEDTKSAAANSNGHSAATAYYNIPQPKSSASASSPKPNKGIKLLLSLSSVFEPVILKWTITF